MTLLTAGLPHKLSCVVGLLSVVDSFAVVDIFLAGNGKFFS
jgi:hypothetical protein